MAGPGQVAAQAAFGGGQVPGLDQHAGQDLADPAGSPAGDAVGDLRGLPGQPHGPVMVAGAKGGVAEVRQGHRLRGRIPELPGHVQTNQTPGQAAMFARHVCATSNHNAGDVLDRTLAPLDGLSSQIFLLAERIDRKPGSPLRISVAAQITLSGWPRSASHWRNYIVSAMLSLWKQVATSSARHCRPWLGWRYSGTAGN